MKNPVCLDRFGNKSAEERREKKGARILKGGGSLPLLLHTRLEKKNMSEGASLNSDTYGGGRLRLLLSDKNWRSDTLSLLKKQHHNAFGGSRRNV